MIRYGSLWIICRFSMNVINQQYQGILEIRNIFKEGELKRDSTVANFATVQKEGGREVRRFVDYYNLDAIISVGYRVKSQKGQDFRKWASLKDLGKKMFAFSKLGIGKDIILSIL